jgi:hypothetical protein
MSGCLEGKTVFNSKVNVVANAHAHTYIHIYIYIYIITKEHIDLFVPN